MKLFKRFILLGSFFISLLTACSNGQNLPGEGKGSLSGKALYSNCENCSDIVVSLSKDNTIVAYTKCDEQGSYKFTGLEYDDYILYAASSSSTEKIVCSTVITIDSEIEKYIEDLLLTATGTLSGTVTLDGSADNNAGFTIYIGGTSYNAKTGNSGKFKITDIPSGTDYEVFIEKGTFTTFWKKTDVAALKDTALGDINLTTEEIKAGSMIKDGEKGEKGDTGATGPQGEQGIQGEKGEKGDQGEAGAQGEQGEKGETGAQGEKGDKGDQGETGAQGEKGDKGDQGETGAQGEKGDTGATGAKGEKGDKGDQGDKGPAGTGSDLKLYSIIYELNGGTLGDDSPLYHIYGINTNLGTPTRDGYSFVGWYTDPNFYGRPITKLSAKSITQSVTLYARWTDGIALTVSELNAKLSNSSGTVKILITDEYPDYSVLSAAMRGNSSVYVNLDLTLCEITSIHEEAFKDVTSLKSIELPSTVQTIGDYAFSGCTNLNKISYLPELQSIGTYAFSKCTYLNTITFPESTLKTIGSYAFYYCTSLPDMIIPDSVTSVGNYAFSYAAFEELKLPEGLKRVPNNLCEKNTKVTKVTLPSTITTINDYAFSGCSNLEVIALPETVTSLGKAAFASCKKLTKITLPQGLTVISNNCFAGTGLTEIEIPNTITKINEYVFWNCSSLTKVVFPSSVKSCSQAAFLNCIAITDVEISSLESWLEINFSPLSGGGTSDEHASSNPLTYAKTLKVNGEVITDLVIPDGTTQIKRSTFHNCTGLKSITIPPSVQNISDDAFNGTAFNKIYITDLAAWCSCTGSPWVDYIGTGLVGHLYLNGTEIKKLEIPEGVTRISDYTFTQCAAITSVTFPSTLEEIGSHSFTGCVSLKNPILPASLRVIEPYAFWHCTNLGSITFNSKTDYWYKSSTKEDAIKYKNTISILASSDILKKLIGTYTYTTSEINLLNCYMVSPEL